MSTNPYSATEVGRRIKTLREARGWTQQELAEKADVSRSDISLWETGKQRPSPPKAVKVCRSLDIELNYLLSGSTQYLRFEVAREIADIARAPISQD